MSRSSISKLLVGLGVSVGISAISYAYFKCKREEIPKKWKKVGTVEQLYFYPIKSCGAIELDASLCENLGMRIGDIKDRSLMLIDETNVMVSARTYPKMLQINPKIVSSRKLVISAPGMNDLQFDYSFIGAEANGDVRANIHGSLVTVMNCGEEYNKWFSQFILGKSDGLRLVYYPYPFPTKAIDKDFINGACTKQDTGTLHDVSSYMLISNNSVEELNTRLKQKVLPLQFRGVFYVKNDGPPFDEDHWQWMKIGKEAVFRNVGPCYRCIIPNINLYTGERDPNNEPLRTLRTYRVIPGAKTKSPGMGIQLGLRAPGNVKRGDVVYAEDTSKD